VRWTSWISHWKMPFVQQISPASQQPHAPSEPVKRFARWESGNIQSSIAQDTSGILEK
jgi:hypothetical protein